MNDTERAITEDDLHAYADGQVDEAQRARIEAFLADNPNEAALVADWQQQNAAIKARFAPFEMAKPTDTALIVPASDAAHTRWTSRLTRLTAAIVLFASGIGIGHVLPIPGARPALQQEAMETLPRQARSAFLVYASEVRHPVEVPADQEQHLANWLGKRLDIANLQVPNLQTLGFQLVGGRLLPINDTPGALFMYEDSAGKRITVLVGRNRQNQTTSFRFDTEGLVDTFYWIDGKLGYAVTGEISRDMLRRVAEQCYKQFVS